MTNQKDWMFEEQRWPQEQPAKTNEANLPQNRQYEAAETDRDREEQYLAGCIRVIRRNIDMYEKQIAIMNEEIEDMYDRYRHDDGQIPVRWYSR